MTSARPSPPRRKQDGELTLWGGSFGVVIGLHGAVVAGALAWANTPPPAAPPPAAALVLELAPLPAAPTLTPTEIPPGPEQVQASPPPPPEPEPEPEPEKIEEPPPVERAAVALPPPKPKPKPPRREVQPRPVRETPVPEPSPQPPAPATTAPQAAPQEAAVAAAPMAGAPSPSTANAAQTWQSLLLGHLERHKRYPQAAQWRRQQGVAYVRFTMDREGHVMSFRLERSSGVDALDEETLQLIQRAQPLPKPPSEVAGATLELVVPVQFHMRVR